VEGCGSLGLFLSPFLLAFAPVVAVILDVWHWSHPAGCGVIRPVLHLFDTPFRIRAARDQLSKRLSSLPLFVSDYLGLSRLGARNGTGVRYIIS